MRSGVTKASRFVGRLLSAAAAVLLLTAPAQAAIDADFNGDGVLDRVVQPRAPDTNIVVNLSGMAPQVLKFSERVVAMVAADIDHDGAVDLSALSERRGVFVWLNRGGKGHLKALKQKHHPRGYSLTGSGPLASASHSATDGLAALGPQDDRDPTAEQEGAPHRPHPVPLAHITSLLVTALPTDPGAAVPSRAPPRPAQLIAESVAD